MRTATVKALLGIAVFLLLSASQANAFVIQDVRSPGGIRAWLVEEHTFPLVSMSFSFAGGAAADPTGKSGLANFLSGMLDEGAGDLDSEAFRERRDILSAKLSFEARSDRFAGDFQTLTESRDESFALLGLALSRPRFDEEPMRRIRDQILLGIEDDEQDPENIAFEAWRARAFGTHPYGSNLQGTPASVAAITATDLRGLSRRVLTRDTLIVSVVGDIDASTLGRLLDATFLTLPAKGEAVPVAELTVPPGPSLAVIDRDSTQSIIQFGAEGLKRSDPDYLAAYVMNDMLGGSGFGSRLTDEIREKRGLTYSIYTTLLPLEHGAVFLGGAATRNEKAGETLELIRHELRRFADEGPSQQELDDARTYITGSYALNFDSSTKIADQLQSIQELNLGIDYIDRRNGLIEALTLADIRRVAKRLIDSERLIVTVVGRPEGVKP